MTLLFCLGGGPTSVNRMAVTALHYMVTHLLVSLDMFYVWLVHNNYNFLD